MKIVITLIMTLVTTSVFAITGIGNLNVASQSVSNLSTPDPIKKELKKQRKNSRDLANNKIKRPTNALSYLDELRRKFKE
ncbi:MAG: hypothetical protein ACJAS4_001193 [Bacteriovoracaceae bacterium]|jgi:hypothetical protein